MIRFRHITDVDEAMLLRWRNSEPVARHMYTDHVSTPEEHAAWCTRRAHDDSRRDWIIQCEGQDAGLATIYAINRPHLRATTAMYPAESFALGKGVGLAAKSYLLEHVFLAMQFNKPVSEHVAHNRKIIELNLSMGYREKGCLRSHVIKNGQPVDVVVMGMLKKEWEQQRNRVQSLLQEKKVWGGEEHHVVAAWGSNAIGVNAKDSAP